MKFFFTLLAVFSFAENAWSQLTVSGKIVNAAGHPVAFAHVLMSAEKSPKVLATQSDTSGHFGFSGLAPRSYFLKITAVGYEAIQTQVVVRRDTILSFFLVESGHQLDQVTVKGAKPVLRSDGEKVVYDVAASVTSTGSDAAAEMAKIPGVRITDNEINIAGRGSVRVMLNGQLLQLSGQALIRFLKGLSAGQLATIEYLRNPPANLDAEGNAGLMVITTRQSQVSGFSANIQTSAKKSLYPGPLAYPAPDYGWLNGTADFQVKSGRIAAYASLTADRANLLEGFDWRIPYPRQTWVQSDTGRYRYRNFAQTVGIDYQTGRRSTLGATYLHEKNHYQGGDFVRNPIYNREGALDSLRKSQATYYPIAETHSVNLHFVTTLDTSGGSLALNADYFGYYRTDRSDFETASYRPTGERMQTVRYFDTNLQDLHFYTLKADITKSTRLGKLSAGAKVSFIRNHSNALYYRKTNDNQLVYDPALSSEFDYRENTQMLYANLAKEQTGWKYQAGLRAELTQTNGYSYLQDRRTRFRYLRLFPSLSISRSLRGNQTVGITLNRRINRPTFWNLNPFRSLYTAYSYGEGNPYLQPEYTTNVELSHTVDQQLTSSMFYSVTDNGFTNVTLAGPESDFVVTTPLNFIHTRRFGVSETFSSPVSTWVETTNVLTAYYTRARSSLPEVQHAQGWGVYVSSSNVLYFNRSRTLAGAVNGWYQFPEVYRFGRSEGYYKVDLGLKASVHRKQIDLSITVNDLFASTALAFSSTVSGQVQRFNNFQFNRFVLFGINLHFGNQKSRQDTSGGNAEERKRL